MDHASGVCQAPSELFILELCEVEGPDVGFVVCLRLLDQFSVGTPDSERRLRRETTRLKLLREDASL